MLCHQLLFSLAPLLSEADSEIHITSLMLLAAFSIGLAAWSAWVMNKEAMSEANVNEEQRESPLLRIFLPYLQVLGRRIARMPGLAKTRRGMHEKLLIAGKSDLLTADEYMAAMVLTSCVGTLVGLYFNWAMEWDPLFCVLGGFSVGFFLPYLSLYDGVQKRHKAIRRTLPYALDLLTLSVEAGLDFTGALHTIAEKLDAGPFRDEIRTLIRDTQMGKSRSEAMRDMANRVRLDDLTSLVSALVQAEELGSSLGPILRIQSAELRRRRFQLAEKKAMQAPVKMLLPLVGCFFPLVFLIVFAPIIITFIMDSPFK